MYLSKVCRYTLPIPGEFFFFFKQTRASWSADMDYIEKCTCSEISVISLREREREFQERERVSRERERGRVLRLRRSCPG